MPTQKITHAMNLLRKKFTIRWIYHTKNLPYDEFTTQKNLPCDEFSTQKIYHTMNLPCDEFTKNPQWAKSIFYTYALDLVVDISHILLKSIVKC